MPHKKSKNNEEKSEQDALIERIDAMMDIKRPDTPTAVAGKTDEPIDIFKDLNTAPPVEVVATPRPTPETSSAAVADDNKTAESVPEPEAPIVIKRQVRPVANSLHPKAALGPLPKPPQIRDDLADPKTDKAVDDITKAEGDAFFEAKDAADRAAPPIKKPGFAAKIKKLFR